MSVCEYMYVITWAYMGVCTLKRTCMNESVRACAFRVCGYTGPPELSGLKDLEY